MLPAVFLVALGTCAAPSDSGDFVDPEIHPDTENAVPTDAGIIGEDSLPTGLLSTDALGAWRSAKDNLLAAQTVMRLGTEEEGPQLFGRIGDVALDAEGNVLVFDALAMELRLFDSAGRYISGVGGLGTAPWSCATTFSASLETAGRWQLDKMVEAPGLVADACVIGDRAFFAGWRADDNSLVQTASLATGAADTGFVQGYQHSDYLVRSKMAEGVRIACVPSAQ